MTDGTGTTTYTWNARNQIVAIDGPGLTASFGYDGLGRRLTKTINSAQTDFLYDGLNPAQEGILPSTVGANLLTGLGIDEFFTRTDAAGARSLLSDALGSTVALTDPSGAVTTEYTYEPFGVATNSGAGNGNTYQYTGRENDGTGLYYYRARYYRPGLGRFVAEDPIGLEGGINAYSYVANNPLAAVDPLGLAPVTIGAGEDGPYGYKPENEDNVIRLCWPGQTCNADGIYPRSCDRFPIKIVDGCSGSVSNGQVSIACPFYNPNAPTWRRAFPRFGQTLIGGQTNKQFHDDNPGWPRPPRKPDCSCR